jgi:hypothetical protein
MRYEEITDEYKEDVFCFLDNLRESGATNMFGAASYIELEFDVDPRTAGLLLVEWMEIFEERHG